jgi:subtilisin family serine protease
MRAVETRPLRAVLLAALAAAWVTAGLAAAHGQSPRPPSTQPPQPPQLVRPQPPLVVPTPLGDNPRRLIPERRERAGNGEGEVQRDRGARPPAQSRPRERDLGLSEVPLPPARPPGDAPLPPERPQPFALEPPLREPDTVLVTVPAGTDDALIDAVGSEHGLSLVASDAIGLLGRQVLRLTIDDGRPLGEVIAAVGGDPRVLAIQPNHVFELQSGRARPGGYVAEKLSLDKLHPITNGRGVTVALVDTGLDLSHEALGGARIDAVSVLGPEAQTPAGHGTEMAAAILAHGPLRGVAPAAELLSIEAFTQTEGRPRGRGTTFEVARALDVAHGAGADIVAMSFAGGADPLLDEMLDALDAAGIVLVAAAGNGGPDAPPAFPGSHPRTITVTATDAGDRLFPGAGRGGHVTIAAPGVDVVAATLGGRYRLATGTSIAAAHVAGVAALLIGHRSGLGPDELRMVLSRTAIDLGVPGPDPDFGAGLVDPPAALKAPVDQVTVPASASAAD